MSDLQELSERIDRLTEQVQARTAPKENTKSKWWILIVAAITLITGGVAAFFIRRRLNKNLRELERLRNEAELRSLEQQQEVYEIDREPDLQRRRALLVEAARNAMELANQHEEIRQEIETTEGMIERLNAATSWDQLVALDRELGR